MLHKLLLMAKKLLLLYLHSGIYYLFGLGLYKISKKQNCGFPSIPGPSLTGIRHRSHFERDYTLLKAYDSSRMKSRTGEGGCLQEWLQLAWHDSGWHTGPILGPILSPTHRFISTVLPVCSITYTANLNLCNKFIRRVIVWSHFYKTSFVSVTTFLRGFRFSICSHLHSQHGSLSEKLRHLDERMKYLETQ